MKKLLTSLLAICILFQGSALAYSIEPNQRDEYYREEEFAQGVNALNIIEDSDVANHFQHIKTSNELEVVGVSTKSVYVSETYDENNNTIDSHLMTEQEVREYKARDTKVDDDSTKKGKLDIYLVVYRDSKYNYSAYGTANWENGVYLGGTSDTPAKGDDYIAITWGGKGELELQTEDFSGQYQFNQGSISGSKAKSDSYCGVCWSFEETIIPIVNTYYADYIDCSVELSKTYSNFRNKKTNISLTYIHTYTDVSRQVSFSAGIGEASASVTLSETASSWPIQVDIPQIWY